MRVDLRVIKIAQWKVVWGLIEYSTEKQLLYIYHQVRGTALCKSEGMTTINPCLLAHFAYLKGMPGDTLYLS
mgnify:CR=1 FL=1